MCDSTHQSLSSAFYEYLKVHNIEEILGDILHSL